MGNDGVVVVGMAYHMMSTCAGNNFFGEDLKRELSRVASSPERESYIVMEKITPPPQLGLIAKAGTDKVELTPVVGELGILGVYLR